MESEVPGQKLEISTMDLVTGVEVYGQKSDPYPALMICLVLPAVILASLFVKSAIKKAADEYYCSFETTGWYTVNLIALILLMLTACLVLIGKVHSFFVV